MKATYQKVMNYQEPVTPLPTPEKFINLCVSDDNQNTLKSMYGLVMESMYLDISHTEEKKILLSQTKQLLERKITS